MRQLSKTVRAALLCCILIAQTQLSFSQGSMFIRSALPGEITLTTEENALYQDHLGSLYNNSVTIVHFEDVQAHLNNHLLTFQIPGTSTTLTVVPREVESTDAENYTWSGAANESGFFSITSTEGYFSGFIQTDNEGWTILPLREDYSLLILHDNEALGAADCATVEGEEEPGPTDYCSEVYNICPAVVDVILFFTDEAVAIMTRSSNPDMKSITMDSYVKTLENSVNLAFANSDIPNKRVRFRWVIHNPEYSETQHIEPLLSAFVADPFVNQTLNTTHRADIGVFVSGRTYSNAFGIANITRLPDPGPTHRHVVVSFVAMASPRWTLIHEITHLFGADHNWCSNVPCSSCSCNPFDYCNHGYRFDAGETERKTIHAINNSNGLVRILHFSNPNVEFLGEPTGVFGEEPAYNAQIIRNTGCLVAGYAPSPEARAIIGGPSKLCGINGAFSPQTYTANILPAAQGLPGQALFTVSWWWNETGVFTYQAPDVFLGTGNQITIANVPACDYFTLHVRVQSADGLVFTASKVILTGLCADCTQQRTLTSVSPDAPLAAALFPNPTSGEFMLDVQAAFATSVGLVITSMDGKLSHDLGQHSILAGSNRLPFSLNNLPDGLYILQLISPEQQFTQLISLQRK